MIMSELKTFRDFVGMKLDTIDKKTDVIVTNTENLIAKPTTATKSSFTSKSQPAQNTPRNLKQFASQAQSPILSFSNRPSASALKMLRPT